MIAEEDLVKAHEASLHNKEALEGSEQAGCFYCLGVFATSRIVRFVDGGGTTGICPLCQVDALLPSNCGYPITDVKFLAQMHERWFLVATAVKPGEIGLANGGG